MTYTSSCTCFFFTRIKKLERDVNDIYLELISRMNGVYTCTPYMLHGVDKGKFKNCPNISEKIGRN